MNDRIVIKGQIKKIQWNNRIKTNLLFLYFFVSIFIFTTFLLAVILLIFSVFDHGIIKDFTNNPDSLFRFSRLYLKALGFSVMGALVFIYIGLKKIDRSFGATPLTLKSNDPFYRCLENLCISRGLKVPEIYMINSQNLMPPHYITAIVLQDFHKKSKLIITPGAYRLAPALQEALLAQVVQRIYTGDTIFLTFLCFMGFFPFHFLRATNPVVRFIYKPFLILTDKIMAPARKMIINMRHGKLDVGSLELTKDKQAMAQLMKELTSLKKIEEFYHEPYLPLFITRPDDNYRHHLLDKSM